MAELTMNVPLPPRSRNFTEDDGRAVLRMFNGEKIATNDDGEPVLDDDGAPVIESVEPAKNVGFGDYATTGAARSAGVSLNRLLIELGAPHKYAVTTRERDGKIKGVLLNKPAKERAEKPAETAEDDEKPAEAPRRQRRQRG